MALGMVVVDEFSRYTGGAEHRGGNVGAVIGGFSVRGQVQALQYLGRHRGRHRRTLGYHETARILSRCEQRPLGLIQVGVP